MPSTVSELIGNEQVSVRGVGPYGNLAAHSFVTTTAAIAALSGGTGSTFDLNGSGLAPNYDAQISVTGGGAENGIGTLGFQALTSEFITYDGTEQFVVGSSPDATQVYEVRGGSTGVGPVMYATGAVGLSVTSNFVSQGGQGGFYFGNQCGPILLLQQPETIAVNFLEIWSRASGNPVTFQLAGGDTNVNGIFNAQATGGWFWANSGGGNIAFFGNAIGTSTDYLRFVPQVSGSTVNCQISGEFGGDVSVGSTGAAGGANLATSATQGFLRIPRMAGQPTGVPAIADHYSPIVHDTTNAKLWLHDGTSWKGAALS